MLMADFSRPTAPPRFAIGEQVLDAVDGVLTITGQRWQYSFCAGMWLYTVAEVPWEQFECNLEPRRAVQMALFEAVSR